VADDDAIVRGSLGAVLELEGFQVDEACTGSEAVRAAITSSPDLILLDLNMPDWDGWTAFGHLDRVRPFVPVIVITARPNQFPTAATLGVDAFMEKPLNFTVLLRAIRQLLGEEISRHERRAMERDFITRYLDGSHEG
jgi:DNA-binding response OmpR family regulator